MTIPSPPQTTTKTCDPEQLSIAVTGDIHVGHLRTPPSKIIQSLQWAFPDTEATGELDLIVINGDFFDMGLTLYADVRPLIILFILQFLKICKKRDIVVRILEGTPSHDNRQPALFQELNTAIGADCKYVDTLSVEYIERFNGHFLFVPDEWRSTAIQTQEEVKALLLSKNIPQVDYAFMHGYFPYQLPEIANDVAHDQAFYESIVKYDIFISHVHVFSHNGKVYAPGSLERLCHGEEGSKGYVRRTANGVTFVVNENAQRYVTINCVGQSLEDAHRTLSLAAMTLPDGSHVRPYVEENNPILSAVGVLKKEFPLLVFSPAKIQGTDDSKTVLDPIRIVPIDKIPTITADNILSFLEPRLAEKYPAMKDNCLSLLKEILNA